MQWDFPGAAASIPSDVYNDPCFQENLAAFLGKASAEPLDQFAVKVEKAGAKVSEDRNTPSPAIITQFLMTLLETSGRRLSLPVLQKRVKDDVCWNNAKLPWRRSPFWLALRVCVQRLLYLHLGSEVGRIQYKAMICLFLARLLRDCVAELSSQQYHLLKVKLCRRLAKLDAEKEDLSVTRRAAHAYTHVMELIQPYLTSIDIATDALEVEWSDWKQGYSRRIPKLPTCASPGDLKLTLWNSNKYFMDIFKPRQHSLGSAKALSPRNLEEVTVRSTSKQFSEMTKKYSSLAGREALIGSTVFEMPSTSQEIEDRCIELASSIQKYIEEVGNCYDSDSEQMSLFILNLFEMWVALDLACTTAHPLLEDYHPWFTPEILDVLFLERWKHMKRLQSIQYHLHTRCKHAKGDKMTIFANPREGCFAEQYFDSSDARMLRDLQLEILEDSRELKVEKRHELKDVNDAFDTLTGKVRLSSCTLLRNPDGTHDIRGCGHCFFQRSRRRLGITIHEDFLPNGRDSLVQQRAVVFELMIPRAFAAYRRATWDIINRLCPRVESSTSRKPEILLYQYSQLKPYNRNQKPPCLSLASTTKSFLGTHYSYRRLPASSEDVLLPHGLRYSYYDSKLQLWLSEYPDKLTFAHHFELNIPKEFPFSSLYSSPAFAADGDGPSSYEVVASIGECPSQLTVHEFTAHQNLMAGKNRRWLSILAELGSSNVNFSLQDTMVLFHRLALQVGPRLGNDSMRAIHVMLKDPGLCSRLVEQLGRHVESIATNWRETNYMETLLTLSLRVFLIGHLQSRGGSMKLILRIRQITIHWIRLLRDETRSAEDVSQSDRAARYCFLSALLCRRTFFPWFTSQTPLDYESLKCFFEASLAMQESLVVDLSIFSTITRNMLVRDVKMVSRMSSLLRAGVQYPKSIGAAINNAFPVPDQEQRLFQEWSLLSSPYEDWATSQTQCSNGRRSQTFYFHILEGHLVVDGQTIGKLPADIRDSDVLKELFGNQRLFAMPSDLPGMEHVLLNRSEHHQVHVGRCNNRLVIQARAFGSLLEMVPRDVFGSWPELDLPFPLVSDCVHWIDRRTAVMEIRQKPRIWKKREGNWIVNIRSRLAQRRGSFLVDPSSKLFQMFAKVFKFFEHPCRLIVFQAPKRLSVEMKRMDLDFFVTNFGQLNCRQLGAIIDRNQDPGCFYGLQSMLVLKDAADWSQRSVIVPLGNPRYQRHNSHVLIAIEHNGNYLKYNINAVLRRLECPADPQLLYSKAQLHALTSHLLPDPLTGRTGTQEALECLRSGYCQPWMRLSHDSHNLLLSIASLTPQRRYYPRDKRCQQTVSWDPHLTWSIQHEEFQIVVEDIIKKSQRLSQFFPDSPPPALVKNADHLCARALWRRSIFEPSDTISQNAPPLKDCPYTSRDRWRTSQSITNVREIVILLQKQPEFIWTTRSLVGLFKNCRSIGGYENNSSLYDIEDFLHGDPIEEWGGLVNLCRNSKKETFYDIMFRVGLMAFHEKAQMTPLRVMLAFYLIPELRNLELPRYPSFIDFQTGEQPTIDVFLPIIRMSYHTPRPTKAGKKHKGGITNENARFGYDDDCENEGTKLAEVLVRQWPCPEPSIEGFKATCLDLNDAMKNLLPEWTRIYQNLQFQMHLATVQTILNRYYIAANDVPLSSSLSLGHGQKEVLGTRQRRVFHYPLLHELFAREAIGRGALESTTQAPVGPASIADDAKDYESSELQGPSKEIVELEGIVRALGHSECSVRSGYAQDLENSIAALKLVKAPVNHDTSQSRDQERLENDVKIAREWLNSFYQRITESLSAHDESFVWLSKGGLWPCLTPTSILKQLRSTSRYRLGYGMDKLLISYAHAILKLQKRMRLREAVAKHDETRLKQELADPGHLNWDPNDFPDWMLLEIDANIQIRPKQVTVALEMISPSTKSNTVLQLNMGEGKTSVIIPMVAAVLSNGEILNRLLVPKALLTQASQILQLRLGGLLGREIIHVPFSRRTQTSVSLIEDYKGLHLGMLRGCGIILGVPDHVLSFKLSGLQKLADSKLPEAVEMIETQKWIDESCRDVLDECDFTLAVKTQLIYPGGSQLVVDGHPDRWEASMDVLGLAAHHFKDLAREFPESVKIIERNTTGFPVAHLLRKDVEEALVFRIADDICERRTSLLPLSDCNEKSKDAIRLFITREKVDISVTKRIKKLFPDNPKARKKVYLLRGLLVHGILILCLKKRWNVQYGLDPSRDPIAVPFHAKGVPSDQAEWGHPDVAILFTCLAFYYEGLSQAQLKRSLEAVLKSDHPATEYERWIQDSVTLPAALRHWNSISVEDAGLVFLVWKSLRFTPVVINYFLNHFVFPVHAKQFATKLQASGWDVLPSNSSLYRSANDPWIQPGITTGFSGTNDNRSLLPLTIEQYDLPGLSHTNAEVLTYLLQERNRQYRVAVSTSGRRLSEVELLDYLYNNSIRILIDAGAFIMEMDNVAVARAWIQADWKAKAAVYFDIADNKPWVMHRNFKRVPLFASPFAEDLEGCVVYIDMAHTRGTDLKLPLNAVGAVTLGLGQTKDHTVQGMSTANFCEELES